MPYERIELALDEVVSALVKPGIVKVIANDFVQSDASLSIVDDRLLSREQCASDEEYFNNVLCVLGECVLNEYMLRSLREMMNQQPTVEGNSSVESESN